MDVLPVFVVGARLMEISPSCPPTAHWITRQLRQSFKARFFWMMGIRRVCGSIATTSPFGPTSLEASTLKNPSFAPKSRNFSARAQKAFDQIREILFIASQQEQRTKSGGAGSAKKRNCSNLIICRRFKPNKPRRKTCNGAGRTFLIKAIVLEDIEEIIPVDSVNRYFHDFESKLSQ